MTGTHSDLTNPILPLYAQLKEALILAIKKGELAPGDRLPSQRELRETYKMSHMTIRRAIDELINEGVIHSIHGKGLYVAERKVPTQTRSLTGFYENTRRLGRKPSNRVLDARIIGASTALADQLAVEVGMHLVYIRRLRLVDDSPMSIATNYLPHHLCPDLLKHDLADNSLYTLLREVYGYNLAAYTATISAALANEEQARLLEIARPAALITEEQVTLLENGLAIDFSRSSTRGDQYYFQIQEGHSINTILPIFVDQHHADPERG